MTRALRQRPQNGAACEDARPGSAISKARSFRVRVAIPRATACPPEVPWRKVKDPEPASIFLVCNFGSWLQAPTKEAIHAVCPALETPDELQPVSLRGSAASWKLTSVGVGLVPATRRARLRGLPGPGLSRPWRRHAAAVRPGPRFPSAGENFRDGVGRAKGGILRGFQTSRLTVLRSRRCALESGPDKHHH